MSNDIYVTEPSRINVSLIQERLGDKGFIVVSGTISFDKSQSRVYKTLVIRSETKISDQIKSYFPNLENIIRIGTGLDNVDLAFCKRESIAVYNAAGANADAVSEYVVGVMLYVTRRFNMLTEQDLIDWNRFKFVGSSMSEQTIGLLGFGHIGRLLHEKLSGFNVKDFLVYDPYLKPADITKGVTLVDSIEQILKCCSIVSLHLPLTDETENMITKERLEMLPQNALLINASRGAIVDEIAVLELLDSGVKFTYIADTIVDEPHGNRDLFTHERIIITPHIASLTDQAERQMTEVAVDNFLSGKRVV